jgi:hypothetical protein
MDSSKLRLGRYSLAYRKRLIEGAALLQSFLKSHEVAWNVVSKGKASQVDEILDGFVISMHEHKKCGKSALILAKHGVLFCQICRPRLKHQLKQTWASLKAWEEREPTQLRSPLPIAVLLGLVCQARINSKAATSQSESQKWMVFSILCLAGFFGLLRPGELLALRKKDIGLPNHVNLSLPCVTISLEKPKNFRQLGTQQFATIKHPVVCESLSWLCSEKEHHEDKLWKHSGAEFRRLFRTCCHQMKVEKCRFSPGSLRAGGATFLFDEEHDVGRLRLLGRWSNVQSLEHYVQTAKAHQLLQSMESKAVSRLETLLKKGGFLLRLPAAFLSKLPVEHRLEEVHLEVDGSLWQACRRWGRAQTEV